jgi:hypothetical protein
MGVPNIASRYAKTRTGADKAQAESECESELKTARLCTALAPEAHLPRIYIVVDECVVHVIPYCLDAAHGQQQQQQRDSKHTDGSSTAVSTCHKRLLKQSP